MIVFLTLCYVAVLAILIKLKVIKLNTFWKLSPLLWMLLLFVILFIPMQWGAPGGTVQMYQAVVSIVPNVAGEVIEVPAKPLVPMKKGDVLFQIDPRPFEYALAQAQAAKKSAQADRDLARIEVNRNKALAKQSAAAQRQVDEWTARYNAAIANIQSAEAQINTAQFNLEQTTVKAPTDGFVVGLSLRPGQRVAAFPVTAAATFVEGKTRLLMGINQNVTRYVEPGQPAEVTFKLYPGKIYTAKVESLVQITPQGQLQVSGNVPAAPTGQEIPLPYAAILALDEEVELPKVPGGALGSAAIYTQTAQATQVIRKVIIRIDMWMNYINPY